MIFVVFFISFLQFELSSSLIMLLQLLSLYASFLFYLLSFVQSNSCQTQPAWSQAFKGIQDWLVRGWASYFPGRGEGGVLNKCLYGEAKPRSPTPYPIIYHFSRKRYHFRIPSIDKWSPFHILCLELCTPLNFCKCTIFWIAIDYKNRTFSRLLKTIKCIC